MNLRSKIFNRIVSAFIALTFLNAHQVFAADRLKDFRGTGQTLALVGLHSEFVEPSIEARITEDLRRIFNKYSRSYGEASVSAFKMGQNPGKSFFKPIPEGTPVAEEQKKFLVASAKDNSVDILVIGSMKQAGDEIETELQLFDSRIETFSKPERSRLSTAVNSVSLEDLAYRVMNYLDRDGFVNNQVQDFLMPPVNMANRSTVSSTAASDDFAINPSELSGSGLAGEISVAGEKTPFWETWWFWSLVGGGLLTAGSLTYYFLVVDQPPTGANVKFNLP